MVKKITRLIVIRILLVTAFLSIGATILKVDRSFFYVLIAATYFLSILYSVWLLRKRYLYLLGIIQIVLDCFLITITVYYTGGVESVFTALYILSILSASIVVSPVIGMSIVGLSSLLYIGQISAAFYNIMPYDSQYLMNKDMSLLVYTAHVHIITFILVGILSASLSRKMHQMEEKVKEKERMSLMGELAAEIAHEIRNPLTSISGSVELLKEELEDKIGEQDKQLMNVIVKESHRVSSIFEQFLDFSKLKMLAYSKHSLIDIVEDILLLVQKDVRYSSVTIHRKYEGKDVEIECDHNRIKQVFLNIITNAIEAMPKGGTLVIDINNDDDAVYVEFTDSGHGMDKKTVRELFEPFRSTKKKGYGLGMAVAHKIVELHGGWINVLTKKDQGTNFIICLPEKRIH